MAHELRIENGKASMFYVDEPPWHGMGTRLTNPATAAEAIKAAKLDWDVRKVPLYACEGLNNCIVPHRHAIVPTFAWGQSKCPVFGIVGDAYEPLQNREAFAFFDPIVDEGKATYHTAGSLGDGERVWVLVKLPDSTRLAAALDRQAILAPFPPEKEIRMAQRTLSMRKTREILRLKYELGLSNRQIAAGLHLSHTCVGNYLQQAREAGLSWPLADDIHEDQLRDLLFASETPPADAQRGLPPMQELHQQLRRKGVTLQLLWEEYRRDQPDGYAYTQFCEYYKRFRSQLEPSLRQEYKAGERMFVDWAGLTVPLIDPQSAQTRPAYLFVAVLGASNYTFVEAFENTQLIHWAQHQVGPQCAAAVTYILEHKPHPEQGYRSCLGLMRLARRHGTTRMEQACQRALLLEVCSYRSIQSILEARLEAQPLPSPTANRPTVMHPNLRGGPYYH